MGVAKDEGTEFHDGNEPGQIKDFSVGISPVDNSGEVEKLRALVYFRPKTFFEGFFGDFQSSSLFNEVEMGENADDFWEAMRLKNIQKLKCLLKLVQASRVEV